MISVAKIEKKYSPRHILEFFFKKVVFLCFYEGCSLQVFYLSLQPESYKKSGGSRKSGKE